MIGIKPKDESTGRFTTKCKQCKPGEQCDISVVHWKPRQTPIITLFGPIFVKQQVLKCNNPSHNNQRIDLFDCELGPDDEFIDSTKQIYAKTNCGLIRYGRYVYTHSCWTWLFNTLLIQKKARKVRTALITHCVHLYKNLFDAQEYEQICFLLDLPKGAQAKALIKLIKGVLPSITTLQRWVRDIGFQHITPLAFALKKALSKLGSRIFTFDATFRFLKAVILCNGRRTKLCLLTIKDEWGNYVGWAFIPSESHKYIVPALAEVVYDTLMDGPFRENQRFFVFTSDNAKDNHKIGIKIFKWIQQNCNNNERYLLNRDGTHNYDLKWLGLSAKV